MRYDQFCPVAKTAEFLSERWMPLIVRELLCGSRRFSEIQRGVPGISPALLSKRLKELQRAGVVTRTQVGRSVEYDVTEAGAELYPIVEAMGVWGQRWARSSYSAEELDPSFLMWDMRRMLQPAGLRDGRSVVQFRFRAAPAGRSSYWLVVDERGIDLCLVDPGHDVDAVLTADIRALTQVWMGDRTMREAQAAGQITIEGSRDLRRRLPVWIGRHPVLGHVDARR